MEAVTVSAGELTQNEAFKILVNINQHISMSYFSHFSCCWRKHKTVINFHKLSFKTKKMCLFVGIFDE